MEIALNLKNNTLTEQWDEDVLLNNEVITNHCTSVYPITNHFEKMYAFEAMFIHLKCRDKRDKITIIK